MNTKTLHTRTHKRLTRFIDIRRNLVVVHQNTEGHGMPCTWRLTSLLQTTWPQYLHSITLGIQGKLLAELLPSPRDTFPALKFANLDLAIYYDTIPCADLMQWSYVDELKLKFTFMSSERLSEDQFTETHYLKRLKSLKQVHVKVFGSANPCTIPALDALHALCTTTYRTL